MTRTEAIAAIVAERADQLKPAYFRVACRNLRAAKSGQLADTLFSGLDDMDGALT